MEAAASISAHGNTWNWELGADGGIQREAEMEVSGIKYGPSLRAAELPGDEQWHELSHAQWVPGSVRTLGS